MRNDVEELESRINAGVVLYEIIGRNNEPGYVQNGSYDDDRSENNPLSFFGAEFASGDKKNEKDKRQINNFAKTYKHRADCKNEIVASFEPFDVAIGNMKDISNEEKAKADYKSVW